MMIIDRYHTNNNSQYVNLCPECFHKRLSKHISFDRYQGFNILLKRLQLAGKAKKTKGICADCRQQKTTWQIHPNRNDNKHWGTSTPWSIYDLLDYTNKELCLDCIDVGSSAEQVPYPANFFAKNYIEDMLRTRHVCKKSGTCEWCKNKGIVFSVQHDDAKVDNRYLYKTLMTAWHSLIMPVPWILMFLLSFWLDQYWHTTSLIFSLALFLFFTYKLFLQIFFTRWKYVFDPFIIGLNISVVPVVYCLSFLFTTKGLWLLYGDLFFITAGTIDDMSWVIFLLDNVIRVVFWDFAEVFGISVSEIKHNKDSILISTYVFAFRTMLGISVINSIIRGYQMFKSPVWRYNGNPSNVSDERLSDNSPI